MTKPVPLSDEAYLALQKMKGKGMSFSDVVLKLASSYRSKHNFLELAGSLKLESGDLKLFKRQIEENRKKNTDKK